MVLGPFWCVLCKKDAEDLNHMLWNCYGIVNMLVLIGIASSDCCSILVWPDLGGAMI